MKKKIMLLVALIIVIQVICIPAYAAEPQRLSVSPSLTFSGRIANCKVTITSYGDDISATMSLWYGGSRVAFWSDSDTSVLSMSKSCAAVSGGTYTLMVSGTIDGVTFSATSITRTCP